MESVKHRKLFLTVLFTIVLFGYSFVQAVEIEKINFKQLSPNKYPREVLLFNTQLRAGHQFEENILNNDIKRLFSTGYFSVGKYEFFPYIIIEQEGLPLELLLSIDREILELNHHY